MARRSCRVRRRLAPSTHPQIRDVWLDSELLTARTMSTSPRNATTNAQHRLQCGTRLCDIIETSP